MHMQSHLEGKRQEDGVGQSCLSPMSLTNQPAVPVHVQFKFCWDGALTVYEAVVAGPWVFGTDEPYEALGIGYHLYVDGMPVLTIAEYVLCVTGGP